MSPSTQLAMLTYLSGEESSATLGHLEDDRGLLVAGSLKSGHSGGGGCHILKNRLMLVLSSVLKIAMGGTYDSGNGKVVFLSILKESQDVIADDDTSLAGENIENTHFGRLKEILAKEKNRLFRQFGYFSTEGKVSG